MGFLDRAVHAAAGAPRLWSAARAAGLSTSQALEVLLVSQAALRTAARHGAGVPGRANAMRHFLWQAVLTARLGREAAEAIAVAQEAGSPTARDSRVDMQNNAVGQDHGEAHAAELSRGSASSAVAGLVPVALEKWERDELVWLKPH